MHSLFGLFPSSESVRQGITNKLLAEVVVVNKDTNKVSEGRRGDD